MARAETPTMKDVAREAGVSLGTVSKVINNIPVGQSYRQKVELAAKKLGYQVNSYARGLRTNRTFAIGLIWTSLNDPYYAILAREIVAELAKRNYRVIMLPEVDGGGTGFTNTIQRSTGVDGFIVLNERPLPNNELALPAVSVGQNWGNGVPCITADSFGGGRLAAETLYNSGCHKLLYLGSCADPASEANKRLAGFETYCRERDIPFETFLPADADSEEVFLRYLVDHIPSGAWSFDGVFCMNDRLANDIQSYLMLLGVHVPEDVQIIGFGGMKSMVTNRPICSSIELPVKSMAAAASDIILNGPPAGCTTFVFPVSFLEGGTTGNKRTDAAAKTTV